MKKLLALITIVCFLGGASLVFAAATGEKVTTIHGDGPYMPVYDEDAMGSDDAGGLATQQSIKAYVDTELAADVAAGVQVATVVLTNAQLLALETPVTLVAAPGTGYFLEFVGATLILNYGSAACVEPAAPDDLVIQYNTSGVDVVGTWDATGFIDATADEIATMIPVEITGATSADFEGLALEIENSGTNYTTCAGTTITVHTSYIVHATGL